MTKNPSVIPAIAPGLAGDELIAAVNDRFRRVPAASSPAAATGATTVGVPSAPGTPVGSSTGRIVGLTIAAAQSGSTAAVIAATPQVTGIIAATNFTYWFSQNGGRQIYWLGWDPYFPGITTAIDFPVAIPTNAQAGNVTAGNLIFYAALGAIAGSETTPIAQSGLPAGYVQSNALTLLFGPPAAKLTAAVANVQGQVPTEGNIFYGTGPVQNPYAEVVVTLVTPGLGDPNTATYTIGLQWTDAVGNPINEGGLDNPAEGVWQDNVAGIPNNGLTWQSPSPLEINYPAPGVDGYVTFVIWAIGQNPVNEGLQVPPFTGNPNALQMPCWPGAELFYRVHVGPAPSTMTGQNLNNQPSLGNPTGAPSTSTSNPAVSILEDGDFAYDPLGGLTATSAWAAFGPTVNPGIAIRNDGAASTAGIRNYCRLTGSQSIYTNLIVPTGQSLYFAFSTRSNNPTLSIVTIASQTGTATGTTRGTYYNVPLNGGGGTGATCDFTIANNIITWLQVINPGSGYTPVSAFTVNVTVAGGSGLQISALTGNPGVALGITAFNSLGGVVNVNGSAQNVIGVTGSVAAWETPAASGFLLFPANVASIRLQVFTGTSQPPAGYWDVTNVLVQPVQNQTSNGQTNTQVPATQPSAVTVVAAQSVTTTEAAYYGLTYLQLVGTSSEAINGNIAPGAGATFGVNADSGLTLVAMSANNTPANGADLLVAQGSNSIQIVATSGGLQLQFNGATPTITINGHTGFTGAVAGRSALAGFVI